LEYGGSPEKAVKSAFVAQIDAYLKQNGKYLKTESKINFQDIEDCLLIVINSFSTQTSYENQTKKAINNKFITEAMTDFLKHQLEVYFIENRAEAEKIAEQVLINKRSRENAEKTRLNLKKKLAGSLDISNRVQKFVDCRTRDVGVREIYIVEGDSALGACKLGRDAEFQAIIPVRGKILNCLRPNTIKSSKTTSLPTSSRCWAAAWRSNPRQIRNSILLNYPSSSGTRSSSAPMPTSTASRSEP
jgi:DNA gyrase subunit B